MTDSGGQSGSAQGSPETGERTLFDLTYETALLCSDVFEGIATGGSTTTVVDTNNRTEDDDYWNGGTLWVVRDAGGSGAAPEKEYGIVNDFANSTKTVTLRSALTVAVASGDQYAISDDEFPLTWLISAINQAIRRLGPVPVFDSSTITIASNKTEYSLPILSKRDIRGIYIQREDDSDDNQWDEIFRYDIFPAAGGTAPTLVLERQYEVGKAIGVYYLAPHSHMHVYDDILSGIIPTERVIYRAAYYALTRKKRLTEWNKYDTDIGMMLSDATEMDNIYPIEMPEKPGELAYIKHGTNRRYPGDRSTR